LIRLIAPILVYSCEIWGFENKQGIEKLHLQFLKKLNLRNNTPNYMVYGEMDDKIKNGNVLE
jgi:hypothetical protein